MNESERGGGGGNLNKHNHLQHKNFHIVGGARSGEIQAYAAGEERARSSQF